MIFLRIFAEQTHQAEDWSAKLVILFLKSIIFSHKPF